jgi:hypothetical protein
VLQEVPEQFLRLWQGEGLDEDEGRVLLVLHEQHLFLHAPQQAVGLGVQRQQHLDVAWQLGGHPAQQVGVVLARQLHASRHKHTHVDSVISVCSVAWQMGELQKHKKICVYSETC